MYISNRSSPGWKLKVLVLNPINHGWQFHGNGATVNLELKLEHMKQKEKVLTANLQKVEHQIH